MAQVLTMNKGVTEGVKHLLKSLLEGKKVRAVLTLMQESPSGDVTYGMITDPDRLDDAVPLYPVMPNNAGKMLSRLTMTQPFDEPVAAVLKPCELRAFVELIKRLQGSLENVVTISPTCSGVFPLRMQAGEVENRLDAYRSSAAQTEPDTGIRKTCKSCEHFMPMSADITVAVAGEKKFDSACRLFANTPQAAELLKGIKGKSGEAETETAMTAKILAHRKKEKERLLKETAGLMSGLDGIVEAFTSCISCHGCREVCPICYCRLCEFDTDRNEYRPETYGTELMKRGGVRVPPGTVGFQIGRMLHMGISCVGCGMCSDVCPVLIPVSNIFVKAGESAQKVFEYIPGRSLEEEIPLSTFEEQEFSEVED